MRIATLAFVLIVLFSCGDRDLSKEIQGFWVSVDYKTRKPFQTLTIGVADSTMFGAIPFYVEINQYGGYSYIEPLDTIHGHFEASDPHWNTDFVLKVNGDTLVQAFPRGEAIDRIVKYLRMDSIKMWPEVVLGNMLLQIDLPNANVSDHLMSGKTYLVADLFLGPLKESLRGEYSIKQDSTALQVFDVLLASDELEQFLDSEQAKQDISDRDSIIVVLNADRKIPEPEIDEWVKRIKGFNANFRVWRRTLDFDRRKFRYRPLSN